MQTNRSNLGLALRGLWLLVLAGGFSLIAYEDLPGHMSVDSVIDLAEGRSGVRITWGPPMYSAVLGFFDRLAPGTSLYIVATLLLLAASWAALPALRRRICWIAPLLLIAAFALPQLMLYQGIVWRDVLFANLTIAAFTALAHAAKPGRRPRVSWALIGLSWALLALAVLVRQNGAIVVVFEALALGWVAWSAGWRVGLTWGLAGFVAPLVLALGLNLATPVRNPPRQHLPAGLIFIEDWDIVGALAEQPDRPMPDLQKANPAALAVLRREAPKVYSPVRSDTLDNSPALGKALWHINAAARQAEWLRLIETDPLGYARRRLAVFDWTLLTPKIDLCLPAQIGVQGPPEQMRELHLAPRMDRRDERLGNYLSWWLDTPFYSHGLYAAIALLSALFLLLRRAASDIVMAGLLLSALTFAASFFVISIACDYRYLYFLDIAAITGLLYVAVDPRLPGAKAASSAARTSS